MATSGVRRVVAKRKRCPRCGLSLPMRGFSRCRFRKDGFQCWCKTCIGTVQRALPLSIDVRKQNAERCRQWAAGRRGELRKKKAAWYKKNVKERRARAKAYYYVNKDKSAAHRIVKQALRSGILAKPESCSKCGAVTERLEAHHSDYARPLLVAWLCVSCHRRLMSELSGV